MEKVAYPDSIGREFICMSDGSYLMGEDGRETVYGEAYTLRDEILNQICWDGQYLVLGENK